jgi:hypothetical protein
MLIKPIGEPDQIFVQARPAMPRALLDHQRRLDPSLFQLLGDKLGLLKRNQRVGVAMNDQRRRIISRDEGDRRNLAKLLVISLTCISPCRAVFAGHRPGPDDERPGGAGFGARSGSA